MAAPDLLVNCADLRECRLATAALPQPEPGAVQLRIERFALTANDIIDAVVGEAMAYWPFVPAAPNGLRVRGWLQRRRGRGPEAMAAVYRDGLEGRPAPEDGPIPSPG